MQVKIHVLVELSASVNFPSPLSAVHLSKTLLSEVLAHPYLHWPCHTVRVILGRACSRIREALSATFRLGDNTI